MSILIGADFVPTESNKELFSNGQITDLFGEELLKILKQADYRIFNLETPLTDIKDPIDKIGPLLMAPTSTINAYKAIDVNLLTLANNHIMDQGTSGLKSTMETLNKANIEYLGVGNSLKEASKPFIFELYDKKFGVYACAEHEFSIVTDNRPGANPYDPFDSCDDIRNLKKECDYVIVLYHGGKEYYRYPSPQLQKRCQKMVAVGADLVICQHSHCIGCEENVQGGKIVYGQGNFLFDHSENESWQTSVLIEITDCLEINYIPIVKKGNSVRFALGNEADEIIRNIECRNREILREGFVKEQYSKFADDNLKKYLFALQGKESYVFKAINKLSGNKLRELKIRHIFGKKQYLIIRNYLECESHHELLLQGLKNKL